MARTPNVAVQNNFIKGLITEATALNFPENACTETFNCIFNRNGLVERRHAFQIEGSADSLEADLRPRAVNSFVWKNVASQGELRFVVVQLGSTLYFYRVQQSLPLSNSLHETTIDMSEYEAPLAPSEATNGTEFNFSSGNGYLFVTSPYHESIYVEYDEDTDDFTVEQITIEIRDTIGYKDDPYEHDERPAKHVDDLEAAHLYNLFNQGWSARTLRQWSTGSDEEDSNKRRFDSPSNADIVWLFKAPTDAVQFNPRNVEHNKFTTEAPKGRFIDNLYDINRSFDEIERNRKNEIFGRFTGSVERRQIRDKRVAISAFFAGRICFSGLEADGHNSKIFFSQTIEDPDNFGKCYQKNDPTSEKLFDLLPTDGGYIDIIEAGTIKKLFPMGNSLLVFATNGIWAITGSQGLGFVANDYSVSKVSAIEIPSATSFVDVEGTPFWWSESGIYTIQSAGNGGQFQVVNLTDDTIKAFYDDIPFENKNFVRGVFDPLTKTIQWVYRSTRIVRFSDKYTYDSVLNYNLLTKAFYPWNTSVDTVKLIGIFSLSNFGNGNVQSEVVDGADNIIDSDDNIIDISSDGNTLGSVVKYIVAFTDDDDATQVTFAECNENTDGYRDWTRVNGVDVTGTRPESYFVSGFSLKGQAIRRWQPIYLSMFSKCEEDNAYKIRGRWNFSTASSTSRWSLFQQFTNTAENFQYKTNKFKVRGDGVACQFEVRSVEDEPFFIVGWASLDSANKWV